MFNIRSVSGIAVFATISASGLFCTSARAWAETDWTIKIPRRSELSPVQRLNREGVEAVKKHQYEKAERLFYKAYLYDPADPFTLNNLGYVSELQGQLDHARKFYDLASEQGSDANIDLSSAKHLEGKPMRAAVVNLQDATMRINHMNVDAIRLLSEDRPNEAATVLEKTLALDPANPFTLNNLGVANEAMGNYEGALKYYGDSAQAQSKEPVVVTMDASWRGKPVSQMAAESARRLRKKMESEPAEVQSASLALHGVYAVNQNDWGIARQDFIHAYSLDPESAFSLNNRGYVAERDGDLETAEFFYQKARKAGDANARVGRATQLSAEGKPLANAATDSNRKVDDALDAYTRERRKETAPVELTPRDNASPVVQQ